MDQQVTEELRKEVDQAVETVGIWMSISIQIILFCLLVCLSQQAGWDLMLCAAAYILGAMIYCITKMQLVVRKYNKSLVK